MYNNYIENNVYINMSKCDHHTLLLEGKKRKIIRCL